RLPHCSPTDQFSQNSGPRWRLLASRSPEEQYRHRPVSNRPCSAGSSKTGCCENLQLRDIRLRSAFLLVRDLYRVTHPSQPPLWSRKNPFLRGSDYLTDHPALLFITLSFSFHSFTSNPLTHIRRAMNQCDAFSLAATQEADYVCVRERDVIQ